MQTTENLGLRKPEENDFFNVEDFNNNSDAVDALFEKDANGSVVAKNAKKLDGHGAEDFFKRNFEVYLEKADIKAVADNLEICPLDSFTRLRIYRPTNAPFENGDFYITVDKLNVPEYARVTAKCVATNRTYEMTKANGIWGEWEKVSTDKDLANYLLRFGATAIHAISILEDETGTKPSTIVMTTNNGVTFLINNDIDEVRRQLAVLPRSQADKNYCLAFSTNESGEWETFHLLHTGNAGNLPVPVGLRERMTITSANSNNWKTSVIQFSNTTYLRNEINDNDYFEISIGTDGECYSNKKIAGNFFSRAIHHDGNSAKVLVREASLTEADGNAIRVW